MTAILTRNLCDGPTVLSPNPGSADYLVWQGAGDPDEGDVQLVPTEVVASVPFQRAVARQLLEVVTVPGQDAPAMDPAIKAHLERQQALAEAADQRRQADLEAKMDRAADRDIVGLACIAPGPRGHGTCGELTSVTSTKKDKVPPLCGRHTKLALQYVAEVVADGDTSTTNWVRMQITPREKQTGGEQ